MIEEIRNANDCHRSGLRTAFSPLECEHPKWVGYFVQRPEAHCIHHEESLHAYNYSELPVFDWLFGTLRDPDRCQKTHGLGPVNELRLTEMLAGVDVSQSDHTTG